MENFPLGHVEALANVNEKKLVEPLLERLLGEDLEVKLIMGDSMSLSPVFDALQARNISNIIA